MRSKPHPLALLAAAAIATLLFAAALSGAPRQPPNAADAETERLIAQLEDNARLHRELADRAESLYKAARISMNDLTLLQAGVCEAELLVATVKDDDRARAQLLDELITLRERIVSGLGPDEPPETSAAANQALAEARVRRWQVTHDDDEDDD